MAKLTAGQRSAIPASKFAGPNRSFPIENADHARAALMDVNKASVTPAQKAAIKAKARAVLNKNG
jgi:hypothetical protein